MSRRQEKSSLPSSSSNQAQLTLRSSSRRNWHHGVDNAQDSPSLTDQAPAPPSPTLSTASSTTLDLSSLQSALETASTSTRVSSGSSTLTRTRGRLPTPPARVSSPPPSPGATSMHQPLHVPNMEPPRRYTVYSPNQWGPVDQWHRAGALTQGVAGATCVRTDRNGNNGAGGGDEAAAEENQDNEPREIGQYHFPPLGATSARHYVVIVGRIPGIYLTWDNTQAGEGARAQVAGVSNCCHQSFPTWEGALNAWTQALDAGAVRATVNPEAYPATAANVPPPRPEVGTGRYIAVFRGRHVGIFDGWIHCASHVVGVPSSIYNRFETFDGALAAFLDATQDGNVAIL